MIKNQKLFALVIIPLLMGSLAQASLDDLGSELIESEMMTSDSEAAMIHADEMQKELVKEQKQARRAKAKADRQSNDAVEKKKQAQIQMESSEMKIKLARQQAKKSILKMKSLRVQQMKVEEKLERSRTELLRTQGKRDHARRQLKQEEKTLAMLVFKDKKIRLKAESVTKDMGVIQNRMRVARIKLKKVYSKSGPQSQKYKKMIVQYKKALQRANKKLNQLEILIDADQAYDQKLTQLRNKPLPKNYKTDSGLNPITLAQVGASQCPLRAYPVGNSQILAQLKGGQSLKVSRHDANWYATLYDGEKAFLGTSCFQ